MDRFDLYELCVQSPPHLVPLLRAIHGRKPTVLGEDFCGTAALSVHWVETVEGGKAVAVDIDPEPLHRHGHTDTITRHAVDVRAAHDPVDLLFAGNFSIGYMHTRAELLDYLRNAHARLMGRSPLRGDGLLGRSPLRGDAPGVFLCDTYGGDASFTPGLVHRIHPLPDGRRIRYTWEQRDADPLTARVIDVLHFRIERGGIIEDELFDAFVYDWRLWSVPELRDAMLEVGFRTTEVYQKLPDAEDDEGNLYIEPVTDPAELDESFIVLVVGRV